MLKIVNILFLFFAVSAYAMAQQDIDFDGKIYTDLSQALQRPEEVEFLDLSKQKLKEIPAGVFQLVNLKYLVLRKNKITEIPDDISKLTQLRVLDMSRNKIEVFPDALCECLELRTIILNQNLIYSVSPKIGNMKNLRSLDLWGNQIDEFPAEISKLQETLLFLDLRVIYMSYEKQQAIIDLLPETDIYFSNGCSCK